MRDIYYYIFGCFWGMTVMGFGLHGWRIAAGSLLTMLLADLLWIAFTKKKVTNVA